MNRKQRRKMTSDKGEQKVLQVMSKSYNEGYNKGKHDGFKECIDIATKDIMASVLLYFRDNHGWSKKRGIKLLEYIDNEAMCSIEDRVKLEDKLEAIKEEMNITIK